MDFINEFRDSRAARAIAHEIRNAVTAREYRIMEVCGGHTIAIFKYGIRDVLPQNVRLISGPGCPVCVTSASFIDHALALAGLPDVIITSFGDLVRVPGSSSSLQKERAHGADVRICYSTLDALDIAKKEKGKQVVFLGIGFETTAPAVAMAVKRAREEGVENFTVLCALKTMPNAMRALVSSGELELDAFICPGHVSTITGMGIYEFLADEFGAACVVSGFEPLDMLDSLLMAIRQIEEGRPRVENQYRRAVTYEGNRKAQALLGEVFEPRDVPWRGLGVIPGSGLGLAPEYRDYDAALRFDVAVPESRENPGCICGEIMRGAKTPHDCKLFARACTPEDPKGACMVSEEGSCATYFKYADVVVG